MIAEIWIAKAGYRLKHDDIRILLAVRRQLDMLIGGLPPGDNVVKWECHGDHVTACVNNDGAFLLAYALGGMVSLLNLESSIIHPDRPDEQSLNE